MVTKKDLILNINMCEILFTAIICLVAPLTIVMETDGNLGTRVFFSFFISTLGFFLPLSVAWWHKYLMLYRYWLWEHLVWPIITGIMYVQASRMSASLFCPKMVGPHPGEVMAFVIMTSFMSGIGWSTLVALVSEKKLHRDKDTEDRAEQEKEKEAKQ